jgi:hypothetical protein
MMSQKHVTLEDLAGKHILDGVDRLPSERMRLPANIFSFRIDGKVYTAVEDPEDGYRSSMGELYVSDDDKISNSFAPCEVFGCLAGRDILELIDCETWKVVLRVGTDWYDEYYPTFVDEWYPQNMAANKVRP